MPYKLTPYDRRVRAQLMREQRLGGSYKAMKRKEQEAAQAASLAKAQEKEEGGNWFTGLLETIGDLGANIVTGLGKGLEGIYDLGAGAVGAVGGLFSDDFEKSVQDHIAKDHVGEWFGNDWQAALDESWLNDSTVGGIIEGVAQGVGQLLPSVGVSIATGGAALPALLTTMGSAAGMGTEQAFQEGAGYGQGMLYGLASGGIEGATEALMPGLGGLYGKGAKALGKSVAKEVGEEVADVGLKRVAKSALGEGVEEMLSEVANPAAKAIYKGSEAFEEYGEGDFWAGVLEAGVIGAGTDLAYGRTVGRALKTTGVYRDANSVLKHVGEQGERIARGNLSTEQEVQARENIKEDFALLEKRLAKAKPAVRERVLKNPTLAAAFDANGTLKQDFVAQMDADIAAATDTTYDRANRSSTLSAETIDSVVQKANAKGIDVRAFKGTLSEAQSKKNAELRTLMGSIGQKSGGKVKYFLAENVGDHGFFDPDTGVVAIDVSTLESGSAAEQIVKGEIAAELWRDTAIHETDHATEGTAAHALLTDHLASNDSVYNKAVEDFLARGYFGADADAARARFDALIEKLDSGETLTDAEDADLDKAQSEIAAIAAENVLGNADFVKHLVKGEPSRAEKILGKIVQIKNALSGEKGRAANREIAFVQKAERLYLNAIAELGGTYRDGKIHLANREEEADEGNARFDAENDAETVDENSELRYNKRELYTATGAFYKEVAAEDQHAFARSLANKTAGFAKGQVKTVEIYCAKNIYWFKADGYMHGKMLRSVDADDDTGYDNARREFENELNRDAETFDSWSDALSAERARKKGDLSHSPKRRGAMGADGLLTAEQKRNRTGDQGRSEPNHRIDLKEVDELVAKLKAMVDTPIAEVVIDDAIRDLNDSEEIIKRLREMIEAESKAKQGQGSELEFSRTVKTDGQAAKDHADRNYGKIYTKKDARKVLSTVLNEQLVFESDEAYGALYGKNYTETLDRLWKALNDAEEGKRAGMALDIADYIIDNAAVESMDLSVNEEAAERLQTLRSYRNKLDLSGVDEHYIKKYGRYWRASKSDGAVSLQHVAAQLRELGVKINGNSPNDLLVGIQYAYEEARSLVVNEFKTKLGEVMSEEERKVRQQDIAKEILRGFDYTGEDSKLARETVRFETEKDALRERLAKKEERFQEMRRAFREERRKLRERFERWQEREVLLDGMQEISMELDKAERTRFFSASIYDEKTLQAIPNMLRTALKTKRAFTGSIRNALVKVKDWYCADGNTMLFHASEGASVDKMADGQVLFDKYIAAMLEEVTSGSGELTVRELEMVTAIGNHFVTLVERYQRVFIDGKWVDAEKMAEEMVSVMQTAQKEQNWIVRGLLNKYMRQFGDPAALFRAMDAYNPKGFYTKMHEWMRNAAISMQSDELHALKKYYEWHEKHKKWTKHLEEDVIEFRGEIMTVGQFMTLYCNSKTDKSKQAIADNGYKFFDKDGAPHRLKGLIYEQKKGEKRSIKHGWIDVTTACKSLENEMWERMNAEQREYVKLLEGVLNTTCRKWKIDTDTLMKGYTLIHEDGYYFPSVRAGVAKTVDVNFYEGDRVGHLSFNNDVVEGARGELLIESIDDVVLRHVRNMALYKNYAIVAENRSMLQNIDVGSVDGKGERIKNMHQAVTIRTTSEEYGKYRGTDMMKFLDKMSNDLQGGKRAGQDEQSFLKDLVEQIRGNYARFQLGLNPKTLATQLSSLIAAGNILEYNCIVRGIKGFASKKTAQLVDKYCPLAELRNFDNSAALAAGVLETTGKVGDVLMKGIGFVDRRVVCSLFYACQLQVQKDSKLALGSEENLKAAGELLTRVILETQQNSLVTEKSDAMRGGIFSRTFTMFTADGMKVIGRWFDAIGEWAVLHKRYKEAKTDADKARLEKELKRAHGQAIRSTSALTAQAVYMALISYLFRLLYDKDEDEVGANVQQGVWDFIGGLIGGLPIVRDIYAYFTDGYELDNFFLSTINDVLLATSSAVGVASDAISGKDVSAQDVASAARKVVYSAGQVFGIPVRNGYNFVTGLTRRIVPTAGYKVDSLFTQKAYASDLKKAIEAEDEDMIETIAGLMIDEKIGIEDNAMRKALQELTAKGYSVLPRAIGDSVTVDGETVELTNAQQKKLRSVYAIGQEAVADMVKLKQFGEADEKVQAAAIKFVYDVYWDLALEDALGLDLAEKNVLFAEAIDIEKLAIIIATARALEADKDKSGKAISGSKKRKVQTFVNSLRLSAAEKYMVMGYLGYSNANGESQVKAHIGKLNLSKSEKEALLKYSGYGA